MSETLYNPPLIEAVQRAAQRMGIQALSVEMDMRPSSLYNQLNPYADRSMVKLGLEVAHYIMQRTHDVTALRIMAEDCGYTLTPIASEPDCQTLPEEMCQDFHALADFQKLLCSADMRTVKQADVLNARDKAKQEIDETAILFLQDLQKSRGNA